MRSMEETNQTEEILAWEEIRKRLLQIAEDTMISIAVGRGEDGEDHGRTDGGSATAG